MSKFDSRIGDDFSFDEEMAKYGCEVLAFDPSMDKEDHKHSEGVMFFNQALSDINHKRLITSTNDSDQNEKEAWKSRTLAMTIEELGHSQVIFISFSVFLGSESFNLRACLSKSHYIGSLRFDDGNVNNNATNQ